LRIAKDRKEDIYVLHIDDCKEPGELQRFMPGAETMFRTPFVAQYRNGQLVYSGQGQDAIAWLEQF